DSVFDAVKRRTDALYVLPVPLLFANRARINTLALSARLPTLYGVREYVEAGGLMSYGPNWLSMWRRAADLVDKILRGAKPAEIPVEQQWNSIWSLISRPPKRSSLRYQTNCLPSRTR